MKTIEISRRDFLQLHGFVTPPENQGQIVEVSYASTEDFILKRKWDGAARTAEITAYLHPRGDVPYESWNSAPKLGRRIGHVILKD